MLQKMYGQKGQMSIFMVLIFQVLFVFFAMTINVGLVVHDKINLQNSVDLAAYYAATKQAEILNLMAHINYRMRQNWKLFSYRIRAIGDSGRSHHPFQSSGEGNMYQGSSNEFPSICTNHGLWDWVHPNNQNQIVGNLCRNLNTTIRELPTLTNIANFGAIGQLNEMARVLSIQMQAQSKIQCELAGSANWLLGYAWIKQFHTYSAKRAVLFEELYNKLRNGLDLEGKKIEDGVMNTLRGNLTRSNLASLDKGNLFINPLTENKDMFNQIKLVPLIFYADSAYIPGSGCSVFPKIMVHYGSDGTSAFLPTHNRYGEVDNSILNREFILGYEKNPWYIVYSKVQATTKPRKPFAPLGKPVTLIAQSYAKPFGSSIGPWLYSTWPRNMNRSQGSYDKALDKLLPPSINDRGAGQIASQRLTPNYSLYPGDTEGLNSKENLMAFLIDSDSKGARLRFERANYSQDDLAPIGVSELSAMTPNVFDITYYSIESDIKNYESFTNQESISSEISVTSLVNDYKPNALWAVNNWEHLLSGWNPNLSTSTNEPNKMFARCVGAGKIPGGCAVGGRVGYSVKMLSSKYLTRDLPLGGQGITGKIKNRH